MSKSMTAAIIVLFAGYTVASYGYVLLRGWDIPWRAWIDPLHAYVWAGTPGPIPPGQVFPSQASLVTGAAALGSQAVQNAVGPGAVTRN